MRMCARARQHCGGWGCRVLVAAFSCGLAAACAHGKIWVHADFFPINCLSTFQVAVSKHSEASSKIRALEREKQQERSALEMNEALDKRDAVAAEVSCSHHVSSFLLPPSPSVLVCVVAQLRCTELLLATAAWEAAQRGLTGRCLATVAEPPIFWAPVASNDTFAAALAASHAALEASLGQRKAADVAAVEAIVAERDAAIAARRKRAAPTATEAEALAAAAEEAEAAVEATGSAPRDADHAGRDMSHDVSRDVGKESLRDKGDEDKGNEDKDGEAAKHEASEEEEEEDGVDVEGVVADALGE